MNKQDPNTWTPRYVSWHKRECLRFLKETNMMVVKLLKQGEYEACVAGLDRIINGLIVMQNSKCGDYRAHLCMLSWCEGNIISMGVDASEGKRREMALMMYEDASDFAKTDSTKEGLKEIMYELQNCMTLKEFTEKVEPTFPEETLDILESITGKF